MIGEKVPLEVRSPDWKNENSVFQQTAIRSALPFWRSRRGFLIHRVRTMVVYLNDRSRISAEWWCGNMAHGPIPYKPECSEGLRWCQTCETRYRKRNGPAG